MILLEISGVNLLLPLLFAVSVPEPLTLLGFGVGLIGATAFLRRVLKRRDERTEEKIAAAAKTN